MRINSYCQSLGDEFLAEFADDLTSASKRPINGVTLAALAEIDAIEAEIDAIEPLRSRGNIERELEAILDSLDTCERPVFAPAPRHLTLVERLNAVGKIASKPVAGKSLGIVGAHSLPASEKGVCPVRHPHTLSTLYPVTPHHTPCTVIPFPITKAPKTWKKASKADKFVASIGSVGAGRGYAFTLNLSGSQEAALKAAGDPTRRISDRINRALKGVGVCAPEYSFTLEISPLGRLHLHGAIHVPQWHDLTSVKRALMQAGGKLKGHAASRQVKLKPIDNAEGWAGYLQKDVRKTKRSLGTDKLTYISMPLRRVCRARGNNSLAELFYVDGAVLV